ncbi:MAG: efflux RND transporter permease subunit, partial [Planctomycetota bacterium]
LAPPDGEPTYTAVLRDTVQFSVEASLAGLLAFSLIYGAFRYSRRRFDIPGVVFLAALILNLLFQAGLRLPVFNTVTDTQQVIVGAGANGILIGIALATVVAELERKVAAMRDQGTIPADVDVRFAGSAGNLAAIQTALIGDGSFLGTVRSSLFLAFLVVYLLLVVLFQSWTYPMVILISVPLATLGGFVGLSMVHHWTTSDRYLPVQNMDVLTILGFVILAGVVVNNAILIVHQALNFRRNGHDEDGNRVSDNPNEAIVQSVQSRVRPILMSTLTSVGGMLPLVFLTGPGSELYRGLGAVITGGLVVSTVFTMFLVPVVLSMVFNVTLRHESVERAQLRNAA